MGGTLPRESSVRKEDRNNRKHSFTDNSATQWNASRQNVDVKIWVAAEQSATNEAFRLQGWRVDRPVTAPGGGEGGVCNGITGGIRDGNGHIGGQVFVFVSSAAKRCRSTQKAVTPSDARLATFHF